MFGKIIGSIFNKQSADKNAGLSAFQGHSISSNSGVSSSDMLIEVWKEILKVNEVKSSDNFFELGGTSIQLFMMVQRMNEIFGTDLSVLDVVDIETFAEIVFYAEQIRASVESSV